MTLIRNVIGLISGVVIGGIVNMSIVTLGPNLIPAPIGVDVNDVESIAASIHLFEFKHFVTPFLAHALGTLTGAFVAFRVVASHRLKFAYVIGVLNLAGGITAATMIPAPVWFLAVDLIGAYLPAAWLGIFIAKRSLGMATH